MKKSINLHSFSNLDSKVVPTPTKCALECNKQDEYRSFTFCGPDLCNLFKDDVHSTTQGELILHDNSTCTYYGMEKSVKPTCILKGFFIDIQNDNTSGDCPISKKRVDAQRGPWGSPQVLIDDEYEWKTEVRREIVLEKAHGGKTTSDAATKVDSSLMFIRTEMTFQKARDHCNSLGGLMFFNVNGSLSQLKFLHARFSGAHWMGIILKAEEPDGSRSPERSYLINCCSGMVVDQEVCPTDDSLRITLKEMG